MKPIYHILSFLSLGIMMLLSCKKDFIEVKPSTSILSPATLADLEGLLENTQVFNSCTPALSHMAADEYVFVDFAGWQRAQTATERNSYIWSKDLYQGDVQVRDWTKGYSAIFYCNNILHILNTMSVAKKDIDQFRFIKGWALFLRAYTFYDLVRNFAPVYEKTTAMTDLGLPLRTRPEIDEVVPRASLQQTYAQILSDLDEAKTFLSNVPPVNSNRPSKCAAYALFARIYLSMRNYESAEKYADSALSLKNTLIDYNGISKTATSPFALNNEETLFSSSSVRDAYLITSNSSANTATQTDPTLIALYAKDDLRLATYFRSDNRYMRRGYIPLAYPFTGLATDELYLIKSETLARRNEPEEALAYLNILLQNRFPTGQYKAKKQIDFKSTEEILQFILLERRKELVNRTLRWSDLKRLNMEGAGIVLTRILNSSTYTLLPNDPKYVFPIPDDEISLSGISQNIR